MRPRCPSPINQETWSDWLQPPSTQDVLTQLFRQECLRPPTRLAGTLEEGLGPKVKVWNQQLPPRQTVTIQMHLEHLPWFRPQRGDYGGGRKIDASPAWGKVVRALFFRNLLNGATQTVIRAAKTALEIQVSGQGRRFDTAVVENEGAVQPEKHTGLPDGKTDVMKLAWISLRGARLPKGRAQEIR